MLRPILIALFCTLVLPLPGLAPGPLADATAAPPDKSDHPGNSKGGGKPGTVATGKAKAGGKRQAETDPARRHDRKHWSRDWDLAEFVAAGFSAAILRELLADRPGALHTGAKPLPPGIAKNLARGKPLPPGIAMKQPGGALAATLPRIDGYTWHEVGRDLVLIEAGTHIVTEIIRGVLD